jgi:hypothetical protein
VKGHRGSHTALQEALLLKAEDIHKERTALDKRMSDCGARQQAPQISACSEGWTIPAKSDSLLLRCEVGCRRGATEGWLPGHHAW